MRRPSVWQTRELDIRIILTLGLVLRLVWVLVIPLMPVSDSVAYDTFAHNIVVNGVYGWTPEQPSAYWAVGTSAVLALLYLLIADNHTVVVGFNLIMSLAVILLGYRLARLYFDEATATLTALILALWPSLIMFTTIIASEILFIAMLMAGLLLAGAPERPQLSRWLLAGLFWTAAVYVRPVAILIPVIHMCFVFIRQRRLSLQGLYCGLGACCVMAVLIAPWTYRNYAVTGQASLISNNFGPLLWMGNNPNSNGGYVELPEWTKGLSEAERANRLMELAIEHIEADPAAFLGRTVEKAFLNHANESIAVAWNEPGIRESLGNWAVLPLKIATNGYWIIVLTLSLAGVWTSVRRFGAIATLFSPCLIYWGYFTAIHAITVAGDRYHFSSLPFIAMLAALGSVNLFDHIMAPIRSVNRIRT